MTKPDIPEIRMPPDVVSEFIILDDLLLTDEIATIIEAVHDRQASGSGFTYNRHKAKAHR